MVNAPVLHSLTALKLLCATTNEFIGTKCLLNMCALTALRHNRELKTYYQRKVEEGKAKMLAINNIRCKLLARVFAVINRNSPFVNTQKFAA